MSWRRPALIRQGLQSLRGDSSSSHELKRRFFACFHSSPLSTSARRSVPTYYPKDHTHRPPAEEDFYEEEEDWRNGTDILDVAVPSEPTQHVEVDGFPKENNDTPESYVLDEPTTARARQLEEKLLNRTAGSSGLLLGETEQHGQPTEANMRETLETSLRIPSRDTRFRGNVGSGRMSPKNYDHLLGVYGEKAYDWRYPLSVLLENTRPMDKDELSRLDRLRKCLSVYQKNHVPTRNLVAHDVPRPRDWTAESLIQYIYDLGKLPHPHERFSPGHRKYREQVIQWPVRDRIMKTLMDPRMRGILSDEVFIVALSALSQRRHYGDVLNLRDFMSSVGFEPTVDHYNQSLADFAARKNLGGFSLLVRSLRHGEIRPDAWTWHYFLACIDSSVVQDIIIKHMQRLGMFNYRPVLDRTVSQLTPPALEEHMQNGGTLEDFMNLTTNRWGTPTWLNLTTANKMLRSLGSLGSKDRVDDAIRLFTIMATSSAGLRPNIWTMHKLLQICRGSGKPVTAIVIVHLFEHSFKVDLDEWAYRLLFAIFMNESLPNCSRVIWQVACARGMAGYNMRQKIIEHVKNVPHYFDDPLRNEHMRHQAYGSKFIAGRFLKYDFLRIWNEWLTYSNPQVRQHLMNSLGNILVSSDLQMFRNWEFKGDLTDMLRLAYEKDLAWKEQPEALHGDVIWMMHNVLNVPLQPSAALTGPASDGVKANTGKLSEPPSFTDHVRHLIEDPHLSPYALPEPVFNDEVKDSATEHQQPGQLSYKRFLHEDQGLGSSDELHESEDYEERQAGAVLDHQNPPSNPRESVLDHQEPVLKSQEPVPRLSGIVSNHQESSPDLSARPARNTAANSQQVENADLSGHLSGRGLNDQQPSRDFGKAMTIRRYFINGEPTDSSLLPALEAQGVKPSEQQLEHEVPGVKHNQRMANQQNSPPDSHHSLAKPFRIRKLASTRRLLEPARQEQGLKPGAQQGEDGLC